MGAITTCPDFLDALRAALILRAGLSGVAVYTAPMPAEELGTKCIVLCGEMTSADLEQPLMGRAEVFENYNVEGFIWAKAAGGGETAIGAARDAAFDIFEEVSDYLAGLTTTAATQAAIVVDDANIVSWSMEQFAETGERHCTVKFVIACRARFTPA